MVFMQIFFPVPTAVFFFYEENWSNQGKTLRTRLEAITKFTIIYMMA